MSRRVPTREPKPEAKMPVPQTKMPSEDELFEKKGKPTSKGVSQETKGIVREGGLRIALKVPESHKLTLAQLRPLLRVKDGGRFPFMGKELTMTDKLRKQIQLGINMMAK